MCTAERFQERIYIIRHSEAEVIKKESFKGIVGFGRRKILARVCREINVSPDSSHPGQPIFGEKWCKRIEGCLKGSLEPYFLAFRRGRLGMAEAASKFAFAITGCPIEIADPGRRSFR